MMSFSLFLSETARPYYVAQDSFKLLILLPLPHKSPYLVYHLHLREAVPAHIPFAVVACGVVLTAQAFSRHSVTVLSVAVALAGLAAGKAPIPGEAPVTLPSIYALETVALASDGVTEGTDRPLYVAVTGCRHSKQRLISGTDTPSRVPSPDPLCPRAPAIRFRAEFCFWKPGDPLGPSLELNTDFLITRTFASVGAKAEGAGGAPVAGSSNHVWAALALASVGVTHRTQRALRITVTRCREEQPLG